jgi:hypothetical protein
MHFLSRVIKKTNKTYKKKKANKLSILVIWKAKVSEVLHFICAALFYIWQSVREKLLQIGYQ